MGTENIQINHALEVTIEVNEDLDTSKEEKKEEDVQTESDIEEDEEVEEDEDLEESKKKRNEKDKQLSDIEPEFIPYVRGMVGINDEQSNIEDSQFESTEVDQ